MDQETNSGKVREVLRQASGTPLKLPRVPGTRPHYKEAYSDTFWIMVETIINDHENLQKHAVAAMETLKLVVNQAQLAMSEMKRLRSDLDVTSTTLKKAHEQRPETTANEADDLKGE